jgi:hypothetical protein
MISGKRASDARDDLSRQECQMARTFSYQKAQFRFILEWEMLANFLDICNMLRLLGVFYGPLVILWLFGTILSPFWYFAPRKIWHPCSSTKDCIFSARIVLIVSSFKLH